MTPSLTVLVRPSMLFSRNWLMVVVSESGFVILCCFVFFFFFVCFLMMRRPPRSTLDRSSAASDVYKRQHIDTATKDRIGCRERRDELLDRRRRGIDTFAKLREKRLSALGRVERARNGNLLPCLLYTSPSPRDRTRYRMPSSAFKKKTKQNARTPTSASTNTHT